MYWKLRRFISIAVCCGGFVLLFTSSSQAARGISDGLVICAQVVIPSLFPFMIMSDFALRSGVADYLLSPLSRMISPLLRLPKQACASVLLSFFSGYPTGAALVSRLREAGAVSDCDASRMMTFCVNAGPAMIVFAVGDCMLGSMRMGWILLACHLAASFIIAVVGAVFTKPSPRGTPAPFHAEGAADAFVNATASACRQMLTVCGFVTLFSAVMAVLPEGAGWAFPLLEVTKGCEWLAVNGHSAPLIAAALGFGGVSIIFQVMSMSKGAVSFLKLILSRACHAGLSALICAAVIRIFPSSIEAASNGVAVFSGYSAAAIPCTLAMLLTASVMLWTAACKN